MATKTATIDTTGQGLTACEWRYMDVYGVEHNVTNGQTLAWTLTDNGVADVRYIITTGQSFTTTDGYKIYFQPGCDANGAAYDMQFIDARQAGVPDYQVRGEISATCPVSGIVQHWKIAYADIDNVDLPQAITKMILEDQFGNRMTIPNTGSGITVA
jgi:hypothetical protein